MTLRASPLRDGSALQPPRVSQPSQGAHSSTLQRLDSSTSLQLRVLSSHLIGQIKSRGHLRPSVLLSAAGEGRDAEGPHFPTH